MQSTDTYLELLHERGIKGVPLERVYRQLFNKSLYLTAYGRIYRNAGAMTPASVMKPWMQKGWPEASTGIAHLE